VLDSESNREQIRAALGPPLESAEGEDQGSNYDQFDVRGPVYDAMKSAGAEMSFGMSFGLSDLIAVPQAIWWLATSWGKQGVTVYYSKHMGELHYSIHFVGKSAESAAR
jgi:hypothetical protein